MLWPKTRNKNRKYTLCPLETYVCDIWAMNFLWCTRQFYSFFKLLTDVSLLFSGATSFPRKLRILKWQAGKMPQHIPPRPLRTWPRKPLWNLSNLSFPQRKQNTGYSHLFPADFQQNKQTNKHKREKKRQGRGTHRTCLPVLRRHQHSKSST